MGLDAWGIKFVLSALDMGMKLDSVCTLGRQTLFVKPSGVASLLSKYNRCPVDFWTVYPWNDATPYADALFRILVPYSLDSALCGKDLRRPMP